MTNQIKTTSERTGGRPRSEKTRQSILAAALELARDEETQTVTIEAIARKAGVSKATIYRWWSSKASIVIDAFVGHHVIQTPMPHDLHPVEALIEHWQLLAIQYSDWPGRIVSQILGEGQFDPDILREFRERFHYGRRAVVREVMQEVVNLPEFSGGASAEELMDMYYGPIYMRLLWGHAPLDEEFRRDFPAHFFRSIGFEIDGDGKVVSGDQTAK